MTPVYPAIMKWGMEGGLGLSYEVLFTIGLVLLVVVVLGFYWIATLFSGEGQRGPGFGYGYFPLALAGYLGVFIFRLGVQGERSIQVTLGQLSFEGLIPGPPLRASVYAVNPALQGVQLGLLVLGMALASYVFWKMAIREGKLSRALPHMSVAGALTLFLGYLFLLPAGVILH
jgi:hypothetical protein